MVPQQVPRFSIFLFLLLVIFEATIEFLGMKYITISNQIEKLKSKKRIRNLEHILQTSFSWREH